MKHIHNIKKLIIAIAWFTAIMTNIIVMVISLGPRDIMLHDGIPRDIMLHDSIPYIIANSMLN